MRTVAVLIKEGLSLFEFGVTAEIFGIDRSECGIPCFDYRVCSEGGPDAVESKHTGAVRIGSTHSLQGLDGADLVIVSATRPMICSPAERDALQKAHSLGSTIVSLCSGAFMLADAGLLDGLKATTHWLFADQLRREHPCVTVVDNELYIDSGSIVTAAGTGAAVDTLLHVVAREMGHRVAATIARRMVVAPHRLGDQRQFLELPLPETRASGLGATLDWAASDLSEPRSVDEMAAHAGLSPRHFARRFGEQLGMTPHGWLTLQRVLAAQEYLESTPLSVEQVAMRVGYRSPNQLRTQFERITGTTPARYRANFGSGAARVAAPQ